MFEMTTFVNVTTSNLLFRVITKPNFSMCISLFRRNSSNPSDNEITNYLQKQDIFNDEEQVVDIEKLRNKSRLRPEHHNILFNKKPYLEPMMKHHLTVKYNRKMYGIYGSDSGVNPGISWPTKDDIVARKEYEQVAFPFTIQEMIRAAEEDIKIEELKTQQLQEKAIKNYAKLNAWKQDVQDRLAKKEADALAAKQKKQKLIEEVRRHFGYKVDPKDVKFQEMMATREKEQRKLERKSRMDEKEKKAIAKLMEKQEQ